MRVGIIGTGTLGAAIAQGLRGHVGISAIQGTTRETAHRNHDMVRASTIVLLCVKPHDARAVLGEIAPALREDHVLISTAAAISIATIRESAGPRARIVRVMPNTPAQVGAAMTVLARDESTCHLALECADAIFSHLGRTLIMDESKMDAATASHSEIARLTSER